MKIANAAVAMQSEHLRIERTEEHETLRSWVGQERPDFEGMRAQASAAVSISEAARSAQETEAASPKEDPADRDPFLLLLKALIQWMTGESVKLFDMSLFDTALFERDEPPIPAERARPPRAGYGIEYEYRALHEEMERTDFAADGVIRTADGKEITFELGLSMERYHREETSVSLRAGDAVRKDPLVVNFAGTAAQLSPQRFKFDIDADGRAEQIAALGSGSGYLALDLNGNGTIDSGAELFGPALGSGFAELAEYDEDGNGWIDENDGVFDRLRVWMPAADGKGALATLKQCDVGALCLGETETPFELRGPRNEDLGAVRSSGIYVTESGEVRTLQEIDLTV